MEVPAGLAFSLVHIIPLSLILLVIRGIPGLVQWWHIRQCLQAIPEPVPGHWFWGHLKIFADRMKIRGRRLKVWLKRCPRLQRTSVSFLFPCVSAVHAETASPVLRSSAPKHKLFYGFLRPWLGDGLLLSSGGKWARDRRLLTHCFHFDVLRDYVDVYTDSCSVMLQKWSEACANGESVNVSASCTMLTLDIILRCAMGFESNCQSETDVATSKAAQYIASVKEVSRLIEERFLFLPHYIDFVYKLSGNGRSFARHLAIVHGVALHLIAERRDAIGEELSTTDGGDVGRHKYRDFLDVLLTVKDEDGKGLTDEEIREQVDTFLFRGHDTTASALQWSIHYLSLHEEVQEKCRREVRSVLQKSGRTVETMTHADLNEMTYLTQTLKESLRLSAPVPFIHRELAEDTQVDNISVPPGTRAMVAIVDVQNNPQYWPEPEKFDPDRFSLEQVKDRNPFAFIPFSAGPRNCIGQTMAMDEMKTVLASVIGKFRLTADPREPAPVWVPQLVARPIRHIKAVLEEVHM